ncbi:MAG TPA: hypothetical protein VFQ76_00235, partial [Longimicrobiaceae bacterium]|nr:hypothetical protein [Longimicrobiaceae bacterium]
GYLARPALTAERFLPDPYAGVPGARMYRTGDRVRWKGVRECESAKVRKWDGDDADAGEDASTLALSHSRTFVLEFLGRADFQVKVRGFRVEPGEVEAALAALPEVDAAAVVAREDRPGDVRLVAYVTAADAHRPPSSPALREALAATLPAHMVPSAFVLLDRMPLNAHCKMDRRALPAPEAEASAEAFVEPATATERALAGIWAEVLGVEMPLRAIFDAPRLRDLAARLDGEGGGDDDLEALAAALEGLPQDELDALLAAAPAPAES